MKPVILWFALLGLCFCVVGICAKKKEGDLEPEEGNEVADKKEGNWPLISI